MQQRCARKAKNAVNDTQQPASDISNADTSLDLVHGVDMIWRKQLTGIVILRRKDFPTWKVMNYCKVCRSTAKRVGRLENVSKPTAFDKMSQTLPQRSARRLRATGTWDTIRDPHYHNVTMTSKLVRRRRVHLKLDNMLFCAYLFTVKVQT